MNRFFAGKAFEEAFQLFLRASAQNNPEELFTQPLNQFSKPIEEGSKATPEPFGDKRSAGLPNP